MKNLLAEQSSPEALLLDQSARFDADCKRDADRLTGDQLTQAFKTGKARRLDSGKRPIEDSPLFGGERQEELF